MRAAPITEERAMVLCPFCHTQNAEGAVYCSGCGQALATVPGTYAPQGTRRTGMATTSLVLGIVGLLTLCLGIGFLLALVGVVLGAIALVNAARDPQAYGGKGRAIGGLATSAAALLTLPIVAAIAIPSLLGARTSANESAAVADVRTVISAQAAYQSANRGFYDRLECLGRPAECIPGYDGPVLLDADLASAETRRGYRRMMFLGPAAEADDAEAISPSSVTGFAYVAVPLTPGRTGRRSFCGDASGRVCSLDEGREPRVVGGRCPEDCTTLR